MKKIAIALLALTLCFGLVGCADKPAANNGTSEPTTQGQGDTGDKDANKDNAENENTNKEAAHTLGTLGYNLPDGFAEASKTENMAAYANTKGAAFSVTSQEVGMEMTAELLKTSAEAFITSINAQDAKQSDSKVGGKDALVYDYTMTQNGVTMKAKTALFANGTSFYSVTYAGTDDNFNTAEFDTVVNSVSFK